MCVRGIRVASEGRLGKVKRGNGMEAVEEESGKEEKKEEERVKLEKRNRE